MTPIQILRQLEGMDPTIPQIQNSFLPTNAPFIKHIGY